MMLMREEPFGIELPVCTAVQQRALRIGVVDSSHAAAVETVRLNAFRNANEFDWKDESLLRWSDIDDAATVFGLWSRDGVLLSTVRATVLGDVAQAEAFLEYALADLAIDTPVLVMSRAATSPHATRRGLNSLIRYAYVGAALAASLRQTITVVYAGGPRIKAIQASGFDLFELPVGWDSEAVARTRPLLASLPNCRFASALDIMSATLADALREVRIDKVAIAESLLEQCSRQRVLSTRNQMV